MSDSKPEQEQPKQETKETSKKSRLGGLNSGLREALSSWETLTEEVANKVSPDQEQLLEVKKLLGELKRKLNQFEE